MCPNHDFKIIKLESVDSTNAYAKLLIEKNSHENLVIVASEQTKGRGQQGNYWHSEKHKNLTFSILLDTHFINANEQFQLNKAVALTVRHFIEEVLKTKVCIKWPNDIYIQNKKIAGVLIENSILNDKLLHSVIGIGINVNQDVFPENLPNPVSMCNVSGLTYDLDVLLDGFLNLFKSMLLKVINIENNEINTDYLNSLFRLRERNMFIYKEQPIYATIKNVDEFGRLILELDENSDIICNFKEIQFVL